MIDEPTDLDWSGTLRRLHDRYGLTGAGQTVVVIDSGIAYDHPALGGGLGPEYHVVAGRDFTDEDDADPYDDGPAGFHGTHVAGIIGSIDAQQIGIAPDADLIGLRVFDDYGRSDFRWIEQALSWVHENRNRFENPITTVNLSIGLMPKSQLAQAERILDDEFAQLIEDGIFVSVAAGNGFDTDPMPGLSYPADSSWVVPVGSVDAEGQLSDFSRRDPRMLVAPGENINSTITDYLFDFNGVTDDWYAFSGTSQAAPFVAGASVLVRQAMERSGLDEIDQAAIYEVLRETADWIADPADPADEIEYARVNLRSAIEYLLGDGDVYGASLPEAEPVPFLGKANDLGEISFEQMTAVKASTEDLWYRFETTRDGLLTAEARFGRYAKIDLDLFDDSGRWLSGSRQPGGYERIDWDVASQETFFVRLRGDATNGQLTLANLALDQSTSIVRLEVPSEVSVVDVLRGTELIVDLDGVRYRFATTSERQFDLRVGADDRVEVHTEEAAPMAYVRPGTLDVTGSAGRLRIVGGQRVQVDAAAGGSGQVRFYGSSGDDRFVSRNGVATLRGSRFELAASGFQRVYVFASGGEDRADLFGSDEDNVFVARPEFARLSDSWQLTYVEAFERVYAYAAGGRDRAFLYGSAADDSFAANPNWARMASDGRLAYAESFDRVYATAGEGGLDRAYLYGSSGVDQFKGRPSASSLAGSGFEYQVAAFDRVYAYSTPGDGDIALLYGASRNDRLIVRADEAGLGGTTFYNGVFGFDRVSNESARHLFSDDQPLLAR